MTILNIFSLDLRRMKVQNLFWKYRKQDNFFYFFLRQRHFSTLNLNPWWLYKCFIKGKVVQNPEFEYKAVTLANTEFCMNLLWKEHILHDSHRNKTFCKYIQIQGTRQFGYPQIQMQKLFPFIIEDISKLCTSQLVDKALLTSICWVELRR